MEMQNIDLLYFGYEWEEDSKKNETDFIQEFENKVPGIELRDAFDEIKGYRRSVWCETEQQKEDYFTWVLAHGWYNASLNLALMDLEDVKKYIEIVKVKYPEAIKNE